MADIFHRIGIKAPAAKVYEAVATTKGVAGWWTRDTTGNAAIGGAVNVRVSNSEGKEIGQMDFEMTKLEANREVRWRFLAGPPEWVGTDVTFDITEDGDTTIVVFGARSFSDGRARQRAASARGRRVVSPRPDSAPADPKRRAPAPNASMLRDRASRPAVR